MPNLIGHQLIEGNRVAKTRPSGMRRGGQKGFVSPVSPIDTGMREPTEHGELLPVLRYLFEVRRQLIVAPGSLRKEELGNETEILVDRDHALWSSRRRRGPEGFEQRKAQTPAAL